MKALVLSVVFALTSVVNAVSGNNVKDFAYNSEKQENGVETQTVYKVKEGKRIRIKGKITGINCDRRDA